MVNDKEAFKYVTLRYYGLYKWYCQKLYDLYIQTGYEQLYYPEITQFLHETIPAYAWLSDGRSVYEEPANLLIAIKLNEKELDDDVVEGLYTVYHAIRYKALLEEMRNGLKTRLSLYTRSANPYSKLEVVKFGKGMPNYHSYLEVPKIWDAFVEEIDKQPLLREEFVKLTGGKLIRPERIDYDILAFVSKSFFINKPGFSEQREQIMPYSSKTENWIKKYSFRKDAVSILKPLGETVYPGFNGWYDYDTSAPREFVSYPYQSGTLLDEEYNVVEDSAFFAYKYGMGGVLVEGSDFLFPNIHHPVDLLEDYDYFEVQQPNEHLLVPPSLELVEVPEGERPDPKAYKIQKYSIGSSVTLGKISYNI